MIIIKITKWRRKGVDLKRIIFILLGISFLLGGVIFILYKNNYNKNSDVVDIFKEEDNNEKEDDELLEENKDDVTTVIVDIKGMVVNPGVYEVPSNYRVNDVILIAGGLLEGADTSKINLAKIVNDEMSIIVYSSDEVLQKYKDEICICDCSSVINDACISNEEDSLVNINTADIDELMEIKGIGRSKAKAIIEYREDNGNFNSISDIMNVDGIGESLFEKIKIYITV